MHAYLNTRVSLFAGRLWQPADYAALLDADEAGVAAVLTDRGLPQLATGFAGRDSRSLEQILIAQLIDETNVMIRPLSGDQRNFLLFWTGRFEISNVKTLLRGKMTGERPAALLTRLTPMGAFGRLDMQELAHTEDMNELFRRLEAGPYASIVRPARRAFAETHDPFLLDAALDRGFYEGLEQRALPLESAAGASFRRLMGALIDRINLVWLLRFRFNYGLPPSQVYYLLMASRYSLPASQLRRLAALDTLEAVLEALPERLHGLMQGVTGIAEAYNRLERAGAEDARKVLHSGSPPISRAFAYLLLRWRELRSVRAVLRGRHLDLPTTKIHLAMYDASAGRA
jgi:V/A-type H+-transporting ATPase subunit C